MFVNFFIILLNFWLIKASKDEFTEHLYIRPLSTGHVYAHFDFRTYYNKKMISLNYENHFDLFPAEIAKLITDKRIEELRFSLSKGNWKIKQWGYPLRDTTPGVELNVWFSETNAKPDRNWKEITDYLSGKFCASINSIDKTTSTSPKFLLQPKFAKNLTSNFYSSLPDETVCTENLTPWKKILPCYSKAGLSSLLNSVFILNSNYFSISVDLEQFCLDGLCKDKGVVLKQTVSVVFNPLIKNQNKQSWSLIKLFGLSVRKPCWLAKESRILIDITSNSTDNLNTLTPPHKNTIERVELLNNRRTYAVYDLNEFFSLNPTADKFNVASIYSNTHKHLPTSRLDARTLIYADRFFVDNGFFDGKIKCKITNNLDKDVNVIYFETLPWYLRFYLHTLKIESHNSKTGQKLTQSDSSKRLLHYQAGKSKEKQYHLELRLNLPAKSTTTISFDVDKVFLKWTDYPPDANRGVYVGSSIIEIVSNEIQQFRITTQPLLIGLPTPDFSMPYNVICLVSTVLSLCFAPIHNFTTRVIEILKVSKK